jgi:hypothetical protein
MRRRSLLPSARPRKSPIRPSQPAIDPARVARGRGPLLVSRCGDPAIRTPAIRRCLLDRSGCAARRLVGARASSSPSRSAARLSGIRRLGLPDRRRRSPVAGAPVSRAGLPVFSGRNLPALPGLAGLGFRPAGIARSLHLRRNRRARRNLVRAARRLDRRLAPCRGPPSPSDDGGSPVPRQGPGNKEQGRPGLVS